MNVHQRRDEWNMVPGYGISPRTRVKQNEFHSIEQKLKIANEENLVWAGMNNRSIADMKMYTMMKLVVNVN